MKSNFSIGCDPELFLHNGIEIISAIPFVSGTKKKPKPLPSGGMMQHDNVAVEFGIPPAYGPKDFVNKVGTALKEVIAEIPIGMLLKAKASAHLAQRFLNDAEAIAFGCDPDYNAWDCGMMNESADAMQAGTLRSCGGHIHIGCIDGSGYKFIKQNMKRMEVIKMMDVFLGIPSIVLDDNTEAVERRNLYGKAGCHRRTDWGLEYRTLSNFWIKSPRLVRLIYNLVNDALNYCRDRSPVKLIKDIGPDTIQECINEGKVDDAVTIIDKYLIRHLSDTSRKQYAWCLDLMDGFKLMDEWKLSEVKK